MRIQGKISRFGHKGFGFVVTDDGKEYFLHQNDIEAATKLKQNDIISFVADENERGLIAREVKLEQKSSPDPSHSNYATDPGSNPNLAKPRKNQDRAKSKSARGSNGKSKLKSGTQSKSMGLNRWILPLLLISVVLNIYLILNS